MISLILWIAGGWVVASIAGGLLLGAIIRRADERDQAGIWASLR